jgi:hypothetical protein
LAEVQPDSTLSPGLSDDFAALVPVLNAELEAIETYLGSALDELLGEHA